MSLKFLFALCLCLLIRISAATTEPLVYVLDAKLLNQLESTGFSLAETLGHDTSISNTADLYQAVIWYQQFADIIGKPLKHTKQDQLPAVIPADSGDIPNMVRLLRNFEDKGSRSSKDRKGGFYISQLSNNSHHPYTVEYDGDEPRHFDTRWLNSKFASFKLIAIANRLDRAAFSKDTCGEVRFVYRLSYKSSLSNSSLPFFVNVVHEYPHQDNCAEFAKAWQIPPNNKEALTGPLKNLMFRQLEVNFQALRFTSGYMHDFGGQAMYMQRVFQKLNNQLIPVALENTPDVLAIQRSPQLLKQFVDYLKQPANLTALDQGTLNINFNPNFLAKLSVSWSTLGRARMANRPYSTLFEDKQALIKGTGEKIQLATFGREFRITRQAIINDEIALLSKIPRKFFQSGRRLSDKLIFNAILAGKMSDGDSVFHGANNQTGITAGDYQALILAMHKALATTETSGGDVLDLESQFILASHDHAPMIEAVLATASKPDAFNPAFNKFKEVISTGRMKEVNGAIGLTTKDFEAVVMGFLDGQEEPWLETGDGFTSDGSKMRITYDIVAKVTDRRGLCKGTFAATK